MTRTQSLEEVARLTQAGAAFDFALSEFLDEFYGSASDARSRMIEAEPVGLGSGERRLFRSGGGAPRAAFSAPASSMAAAIHSLSAHAVFRDPCGRVEAALAQRKPRCFPTPDDFRQR